MAFISATALYRVTPSGMARRGGQSRRAGSRRSAPRPAKRRRPSERLDPILDDGDIDTTDITTFVSCPVCFNSIMLRPEQLATRSLRVTCNVCETRTVVTLGMLENMDGSPFDEGGWRRGYRAEAEILGDGADEAVNRADDFDEAFVDAAVLADAANVGFADDTERKQRGTKR